MRRRQDPAEVPLTELLEAAGVATPGALVDLLAERGDACVVDPLGRLAVPPAVAERLRAEHSERERIAAIELERAEEERLRRLAEYTRQREEAEMQQARQLAIRQRMQRVEQAVGLPLWQLEQEVRRSRTHAPGAGMSYAGRAVEDEKPITLGEVERYIVERYGAEVLAEGGKA